MSHRSEGAKTLLLLLEGAAYDNFHYSPFLLGPQLLAQRGTPLLCSREIEKAIGTE